MRSGNYQGTSSRVRNERGDFLLEIKTSQEIKLIQNRLPYLTIIFHFLLAQKMKQKKASYVEMFFWPCLPLPSVVGGRKNRKSAAKFSPGLQKFLTLLICYTHTRSVCLAKLAYRHLHLKGRNLKIIIYL